jgi:hypothetical protein
MFVKVGVAHLDSALLSEHLHAIWVVDLIQGVQRMLVVLYGLRVILNKILYRGDVHQNL